MLSQPAQNLGVGGGSGAYAMMLPGNDRKPVNEEKDFSNRALVKHENVQSHYLPM